VPPAWQPDGVGEGGGVTLSENVPLALAPAASVTLTLRLEVPVAVGASSSSPDGRSVRPAGGVLMASGRFVPVPPPVSGTICGLPGALSVRTKLAVRVPDAVGLEVIDTLQLVPAARVRPEQPSFTSVATLRVISGLAIMAPGLDEKVWNPTLGAQSLAQHPHVMRSLLGLPWSPTTYSC
jgi:hypothetical protein